jgi:hypothetical protein
LTHCCSGFNSDSRLRSSSSTDKHHSA